MPNVASRGHGRGRRTINEINMVPFIDVMLVLLIIFMVTAPMLTPSMINLPSVGKAANQPPKVAQIVVERDGGLQFKTSEQSSTIGIRDLGRAARRWQDKQSGESAVVISADKDVKYENVVKAMDELRRAGVKRVGLSVRQVN